MFNNNKPLQDLIFTMFIDYQYYHQKPISIHLNDLAFNHKYIKILQ